MIGLYRLKRNFVSFGTQSFDNKAGFTFSAPDRHEQARYHRRRIVLCPELEMMFVAAASLVRRLAEFVVALPSVQISAAPHTVEDARISRCIIVAI